MAERNYYIFDDVGGKHEAMTKSEILTAIFRAVAEHGTREITIDDVQSVKEINKGDLLSLWIGTEDDYESITFDQNTLYIISEHHEAKEDLIDTIQQINNINTQNKESIAASEVAAGDLKNAYNEIEADIRTLKSAKREIDSSVETLNSESALLVSSAADLSTDTDQISTEANEHVSQRDQTTVLFDGNREITDTEIALSADYKNYNELIFAFAMSENNPKINIVVSRSAGIEAGNKYYYKIIDFTNGGSAAFRVISLIMNPNSIYMHFWSASSANTHVYLRKIIGIGAV